MQDIYLTQFTYMFIVCPINISGLKAAWDSLCAPVLRVPGYRSIGQGSVPGATRISEKQWVWRGVHSAS
jgi:hypothetical protein